MDLTELLRASQTVIYVGFREMGSKQKIVVVLSLLDNGEIFLV